MMIKECRGFVSVGSVWIKMAVSGLSLESLRNKIKVETSVCLDKILKEIKLRRIVRMISSGEKAEVVTICSGYSNERYVRRLVKNESGMTHSEVKSSGWSRDKVVIRRLALDHF